MGPNPGLAVNLTLSLVNGTDSALQYGASASKKIRIKSLSDPDAMKLNREATRQLLQIDQSYSGLSDLLSDNQLPNNILSGKLKSTIANWREMKDRLQNFLSIHIGNELQLNRVRAEEGSAETKRRNLRKIAKAVRVGSGLCLLRGCRTRTGAIADRPTHRVDLRSCAHRFPDAGHEWR